jgi:RNA polymerase sigma-70 factor (ECF subfamily)
MERGETPLKGMAVGRLEGEDISAAEFDAFDAFFTRHERALYGYLRRLLPSDEVAVEIAQEAFFRAWTHFAKIQHYDRPHAWLYRVATNLALGALRRRQPMPFSQLFSRQQAGEESDESPDDTDMLFADTGDVEEQTAERDAITRALSSLGERERAALLLRALHGFSHDEVAEALGVSPVNARTIAARARYHFRQRYDAETQEHTDGAPGKPKRREDMSRRSSSARVSE